MRRFQSIFCASLLTLAIASPAFAGNITLLKASGNITLERASGNITLERASGNITLEKASGNSLLEKASGEHRLRTSPNLTAMSLTDYFYLMLTIVIM